MASTMVPTHEDGLLLHSLVVLGPAVANPAVKIDAGLLHLESLDVAIVDHADVLGRTCSRHKAMRHL